MHTHLNHNCNSINCAIPDLSICAPLERKRNIERIIESHQHLSLIHSGFLTEI